MYRFQKVKTKPIENKIRKKFPFNRNLKCLNWLLLTKRKELLIINLWNAHPNLSLQTCTFTVPGPVFRWPFNIYVTDLVRHRLPCLLPLPAYKQGEQGLLGYIVRKLESVLVTSRCLYKFRLATTKALWRHESSENYIGRFSLRRLRYLCSN